ncbi:hypothetical protein AB1286_33090 [Trinickia sp. NRRL B-1857]|uniref:hypothetical protein n=1 Tax=Trinickia sp. NRRL B-1857 TaxID=3162879 RepID=UPI003D2C7523
MYVQIEKAMAKITSVTPIMEKHGKKKKRPAHSIIFEFAMSNTVLDRMVEGLRDSFYRKPTSASVNKAGQTEIDTSSVTDGISQLRFSWWQQWIDVPGELTGWVLTLHTGNTERSHIVLDDAKVSAFQVLPKDLAIVLVKCKAIVHPTAHEKGKIDELLQTDVPVSIQPPDTGDQQNLPGMSQQSGGDAEGDSQSTDGDEGDEREQSGNEPREDPFAGSDLARGKVNSDAKVSTKKSRGLPPEAAWPFPNAQPGSPADEYNKRIAQEQSNPDGDPIEGEPEEA